MLNLLIPLQPEEKVVEESLQAFYIGVSTDLTDMALLGTVFIAFAIFIKIVWKRWDP